MGFAKKALKFVLPLAMIALPFLGLPVIPLLGMKIGLGTILAVVGGVASAALAKKPKVSRATTERLLASLDPSAPRTIVFGRTAMATDVRYHAYTGTNQEYYEQIVCVASHAVEAIEEIWLDSELAWTSAGGAQGRFAGYLTVTTRLVGTSANGIAIDGAWTTACTLTGCAYFHAKYKLTGNSKSAESPFAQGVPQRMTVRGKGAKVPDPRLSTGAGGSGSQSMTDQTTWAYTTAADSGRNPACQLLFYLLGWKINSKLAVALGAPSPRIDFASFITGSNMCDESVAKVGGGTEPRYRSDGVFNEDDDPDTVLTSLLQAMNGELTDENGKLALRLDYDDLASPVATFTEADILDGDDWKPTGAEADVNVVRGRFTDPSNTALYQLVDYPQVTLAGTDYGSPDGIQRIESFDLPVVQSPSQAQRLAKLRLQRKQYPGMFSARFNMKGWAATYGRVVSLTYAPLGFSAKKFRVVGQKLRADGSVELALREVNSAQYVWSAEEAAVATPAAPTPYDPLNNPLVVGIGDAEGATIGVDLRRTDGTTIATETGTNGVANVGVSISTAGALAGGGGGQVTITGLGYVGELNAQHNLDTDLLVDAFAYANSTEFGAKWGLVAGATTEVVFGGTDTSVPGGKYVRFGNNSGDDTAWYYWKGDPIPYDPNALYEVAAIARKVTGSGLAYFGVEGLAADRTTMVASDGLNAHGNQHYVALNNANIGSTFALYRGYLKGRAATGSTSQFADPASPGVAHTNVVYIRPLLIVNFNGASGQTDVAFFRVRKIDPARLGSMILGADGATVLTESGSAGVRNTALTISSGGALAGGGGGQVTVLGMEGASGYILRNDLIGLDGSGALYTGVVTTATVRNSNVSISASGSLAGGGGGQVTIGGLGYVGDLRATYIDNTVKNGDFSLGQTGYTNGPGASYAANNPGAPAPHSVKFASGQSTANSYTYVNNAVAAGFIGRRAWVSFSAYPVGVATTVTANFIFYDAAGNVLTTPTVAIDVAATGAFANAPPGFVDAPAGTASYVCYLQRTGANTADFHITAIRIAPTQPGANVGSRVGTDLLLADGVTFAAESGSAGVRNNAVSISASGALSGGGGGQVTIGGLGYAGDLDAQRNPDLDLLLDDFSYPTLAEFQRRWIENQGSGEYQFALVDVAKPGGLYMRIGNNAGSDERWLSWKGDKVPYDPAALYEVVFMVRMSAGSGVAYLGLDGWASDGTTRVNTGGTNAYGSQHYVAAANVTIPSAWTVYRGYVRGRSATGSGAAFANPASPGVMHNNVAYIAPMILVNFSGAAGITDVGFVRLRKVELSRLGSMVLAEDGSTVLTDSGSAGVRNTAVSLSASGALSGAGGGQIGYDSLADGSTYAKILANQLTSGAHKVTVAGSGMRVGDARNLVAVTAANAGYKFTGTISYVASAGTPATATISVTAGNVLMGATVAYNASSVGVSGTGGTSVTYQLYYNDAAFAGGSQTLIAVVQGNTAGYENSGYIWVGQCTVIYPTSGTGGGGGSGGGGFECVWANAWVETRNAGFVLAREIEAGDVLRVLSDDRQTTDWEPCTGNSLAIEDGWVITSASGVAVTVSGSTPITLRDGRIISVAEINEHELPVFVSELVWEPCTARRTGRIEVAHILCGQRTYAAGDVAGRQILTHNPKP